MNLQNSVELFEIFNINAFATVLAMLPYKNIKIKDITDLWFLKDDIIDSAPRRNRPAGRTATKNPVNPVNSVWIDCNPESSNILNTIIPPDIGISPISAPSITDLYGPCIVDFNNIRPGLNSNLNNTRSDLNNTRPGLNNTRPGLNNPRPGLNSNLTNTRSELNNTRPGLNNIRRDLNSNLNNPRPGPNSNLNNTRPGLNNTRPGLNNIRRDLNSNLNNTRPGLNSNLNNTRSGDTNLNDARSEDINLNNTCPIDTNLNNPRSGDTIISIRLLALELDVEKYTAEKYSETKPKTRRGMFFDANEQFNTIPNYITQYLNFTNPHYSYKAIDSNDLEKMLKDINI